MKNNDKLLDIIGEVDEKVVPDLPEKRPSTLWMKLSAAGCGVAAAALLGIVILGGGGREQPPYGGGTSDIITNYTPEQSTPDPSDSSDITTPDVSDNGNITSDSSDTTTEPVTAEDTDLPPLYPDFDYEPVSKALSQFSANIFDIKGAGFEGESSYDFEQFIYRLRKNPWNETMFETLPVFHNEALSQYGTMQYFSKEAMVAMAENAVDRLEKEIAAIEGQDVDKPHRIAVSCIDGAEIQVYGNGEIYISFETPVPLPEGYSYDTSEGREKAMVYLVEKYNRLFGFENPDCFFDSEITDSILVYDRSGGHLREMLNYNLCYARLLLNDDGSVYRILIENALCSSVYMGDYPVISLSEALQMLCEGKFLANVFGSYINYGVIYEWDIVGVELVYRLNTYEEYLQPYYCFYVAADMGEGFSEMYPGLTNYAALYVPAVSEEYTGKLTDWYAPYGTDSR